MTHNQSLMYLQALGGGGWTAVPITGCGIWYGSGTFCAPSIISAVFLFMIKTLTSKQAQTLPPFHLFFLFISLQTAIAPFVTVHNKLYSTLYRVWQARRTKEAAKWQNASTFISQPSNSLLSLSKSFPIFSGLETTFGMVSTFRWKCCFEICCHVRESYINEATRANQRRTRLKSTNEHFTKITLDCASVSSTLLWLVLWSELRWFSR